MPSVMTLLLLLPGVLCRVDGEDTPWRGSLMGDLGHSGCAKNLYVVKQYESMRPAETCNMLAYALACVAIWMHS